jgi:hypothetical protein
MTAYAGVVARGQRGGAAFGRTLVVAAVMGAVGLVCAAIAYMLWPAPAAVAPDAPSLPITIGEVMFNIPPAAIRFKMQRHPGTQPRVDLNFVWPTLEPPDNRIKPPPTVPPDVTNRLFASISAADGTLPPMERLKLIYPRYLDGVAVVGADGLSLQSFRDRSPYQGEDLIADPSTPEQFLLRCSRQIGSTPAMCLHERRIEGADLMIRFPREWLNDWRAVAEGIERLVASFRPMARPG